MIRAARVAATAWLFVLAQLVTSAASPPERGSPPLAGTPRSGRITEIPVEGEIELGLAAFVHRIVKDAKPEDTLILHINTFGGRIDAAVQIRDALLGTKALTVAYIDSRAISAGALIALATDVIVMTHGATIGAATPVQLEGGKMQPVEAKVVSYFRKEMKATAEAKGRRGDLAEAMVDAAVEIPGLDTKESTLTLTTAEAIKWKLAGFEAGSVEDACAKLGRPSPSILRPGITWAERIARFLSESAISSLLMTLGMLGILVELWSPGHAVSGVLGVLCLLLFFFGHYVVHLAGWEELLLFGVGAALVIIELIAFPGHGAIAVAGILMILGSLVMALMSVKYVPIEISWSLGWVPSALTRVFGSMLLTALAMMIVTRFLPKTRLGRPLILETAITGSIGEARAESAPATDQGALAVGARGVAETVLRPAGKARFEGQRFDVETQGDFLEPGTPVIVTEIDGTKVVVRKA